ncbi:STAS domain-containing protein [Idiomarina fontislapidosi]|uniref:MlaB-like STAS domain-containing protein n=1 Tax=Idiomarina fontislapidosi TaxID=263723 RepID=A0A432YAX8_9GAMM|nr:STAS domain-containing protein [Idiomarina fontislapidosi]PYE35177.1 STAS domain-containing protein [Idiomarina fontislapidosi]RUO58072.1 hypothetical protein CWE25_00270 [Idiomarina fontislapidosi]
MKHWVAPLQLTIFDVRRVQTELEEHQLLVADCAVDLSTIEELDTSGAQLLLYWIQTAARLQKRWKLIGHNTLVDSTFELLGGYPANMEHATHV